MTAENRNRARRHDAQAAPLVWVLLGHRTGDNLQLHALAGALGWPAVEKPLKWRRPLPRWSPVYGRAAGLKHLDTESRAAFAPPWPDLVLSIGWRSVPVARWIRNQCGARLVHLGRPRAPLDQFDLVLSTPQYRLPEAPNVLPLPGPISALTPERLAAAGAIWTPRLSHLPRPWTAVLIGGDAPPLRFPAASARALAAACNRFATQTGGTLLVATGPRTPPQSFAAFRDALSAPAHIHQWGQPGDNPYAGFLALADRFVVTGDSISMAHEAAARGRPLHIFPLPSTEDRLRARLRGLHQRMRHDHQPFGGLYRRMLSAGLLVPPRFVGDYFDALIRSGRANLLGAAEVVPRPRAEATDTDRAVAAVRALF